MASLRHRSLSSLLVASMKWFGTARQWLSIVERARLDSAGTESCQPSCANTRRPYHELSLIVEVIRPRRHGTGRRTAFLCLGRSIGGSRGRVAPCRTLAGRVRGRRHASATRTGLTEEAFGLLDKR